MAGAEADGYEQAEGYASYTLPCGEYAVCRFEAENFAELVGSAIFKAYAFMNNWMKKHGLTCGNFAAEMYYDTSPDAITISYFYTINAFSKTSGFFFILKNPTTS